MVIIGISCGTASSVSDVVIEATVEAREKATVESVVDVPVLTPSAEHYSPAHDITSFQWESSGNARTNTFTITKPEFGLAYTWLSTNRTNPNIQVRVRRARDNSVATPVFFSGDNLAVGVISVQERGDFYIEVIRTGEWLIGMNEKNEAIPRWK